VSPLQAGILRLKHERDATLVHVIGAEDLPLAERRGRLDREPFGEARSPSLSLMIW
jgi:hypothetical protein